MPFGLCNAPATFQRCMTEIFHELIEDSMEVFMDDFFIFGNSFDHCLKYLEKMLKRYEETNLVLNWEKCHFMVKEGIVLGHKVSGSGIEEFDIEILDKKGAENLAVGHLSRLKNPDLRKLTRVEIRDLFLEERLMAISDKNDESWLHDDLEVNTAKVRVTAAKHNLVLLVILVKNMLSKNGNSFKPVPQTTTNADGSSTSLIPDPVTTEEKVQKKNDVKARSMLLMELPDEHLMTFNQYKDAKTFAPSTKSLDSIFNRLQKIVSQLAILGENISQEYLNLKFLRSLPSEWNTHVVVWRNKPDLDTISFDDLYNNFKIVEQEIKGTASSSSSSSSQNMDFVSSPSSTNEVNTAYEVSNANTQVSPASTQVSTAIQGGVFQLPQDGTLYKECRGPRNQDSKNRNQDSSRRTINVEETSSKAMVAIDGAGFDWSYMADDEVPTNMAFMAFLDSKVHNDKTCSKTCLKSFETLKTQLDDLRLELNKFEFNLATYKRGLAFVEKQLVFYKKNDVIFCKQLAVLKRDISYKDSETSMLKSQLEKLKQEKESSQLKIENFDNASKSLDKLIRSQITDKSRKGVGFVSYNVVPHPTTGLFSPLNLDLSYSDLEEFHSLSLKDMDVKLVRVLVQIFLMRSQTPRGNQRNWNNQKSQQLGSDFVMYNKACFVCGSFDHVQADCNYHQRERVVSGNNYTRVNYNYSAKQTHPSAHRNIVPRSVLMKTGIRPLNIARHVNTAHPKTIVYSARPMPNSAVVNTVREHQVNAIKASAGWVWRPTKLNSASITLKRHNYVDARGRSKHMIGNMSYLSDFKEFDGGYVTFRGGAKGEKITGKETLKTGKLDFKDVYFVKELQFNLFSVSQMCDKKNSVLFTDTGCFVLSPDFKLADESQVLLKVPRKNNMYSVDMKNIVPKECLTCLVVKATLDESMLWHRRLGHVNFKTINKLVKENRVRVVTDDYSRFTWVFFLATKDETSGILKSFITEIENLVDKKVKIIRCDNGTEFKNRVMTRTMLADSKLPTTFWAEAVNTACYVQNRVLVVKPHNKTHYELFRGKFDGKSNEGFFVGYSMNSKAFRVYNIRTRKVEENLHIRFLEDKPIIAGTNSNDLVGIEESIDACHSSKETGSSQDYILMPLYAGKKDDEGVNKESEIDDQERHENSTPGVNTAGPSINTASKNINTGSLNINTVSPTVTTAPLEDTHADFFGDEIEVDMSNITTTYLVPSTPNTRIHKDHSLDHVINDVQSGVQTRRMTKITNEQGFLVLFMKRKLMKTFILVCLLVSYPRKSQKGNPSIKISKLDRSYARRASAVQVTTVYRNKKDERGIVVRNKARLVTQGYTQEEGIDYDEVLAPVARIEAIRLFLAYASFKDFVVYQMDAKSAFLYGKIEEEVYVCQPLGFEDPEFPDRVYKVEKALSGLHQAPRACDILLVQVYVDDIIFGSTKKELCTEFEKLMHKKFQMSSMGELTFFLGLQVTQKDDGIFISQDKYVDEILKKFGFSTMKTASTPMETSKPLMKDENAKDVDVYLYRLMIGSLMYLTSSRPDIMFVVCACARFQVTPKVSRLHAVKRIFRYLKGQPKLGLWYPKDSPFDLEAYTDSDYAGVRLDRKSTTVKNPVFHSKTKHIEIRHHFIKDSNKKKLIQMIKIHTYQNAADLLTEAFDVGRFQYLIASIGMLNL
ncbi:putative ribonuclease H-like domain-containing protein [Tanacetum coccineum]